MIKEYIYAQGLESYVNLRDFVDTQLSDSSFACVFKTRNGIYVCCITCSNQEDLMMLKLYSNE